MAKDKDQKSEKDAKAKGGAKDAKHDKGAKPAPSAKPAEAKPAIDLRDLVITGFCPAIFARSATALSRIFLSATASPTPMFRVILAMRGTCILVL